MPREQAPNIVFYGHHNGRNEYYTTFLSSLPTWGCSALLSHKARLISQQHISTYLGKHSGVGAYGSTEQTALKGTYASSGLKC